MIFEFHRDWSNNILRFNPRFRIRIFLRHDFCTKRYFGLKTLDIKDYPLDIFWCSYTSFISNYQRS